MTQKTQSERKLIHGNSIVIELNPNPFDSIAVWQNFNFNEFGHQDGTQEFALPMDVNDLRALAKACTLMADEIKASN